jgi:PleD family two-component response regulator
MERKVCLLIDDDADDRNLFSTAMGELESDLEVITIKDANTAIHDIRDGKIRPSIIFLDLNMPCVNGYQVLVYLKGQIRHRKIPVVVYSTSNDPDEVKRTKKLGATAFFEKPVTYSDLKQRLSDLLSDVRVYQRQTIH